MDPAAIARRLIGFAREAEPIEVEVRQFATEDVDERILVQEFGLHQRYGIPGVKMLGELQEALADAGWNPDLPDLPGPDRGRWRFGTALTLREPSREIHRGFLDPVRRVPILSRVPDEVAFYLITIDDGEDYLENEVHSGVGWHYHYLDWRKNRSDVVLCWDTRWVASSPKDQRGLFVEKHAEGGKPFVAKPSLWGATKRRTMYDVCSADLAKRRIGEYRCAANKAAPVYPTDATLTPHPSSTAAAEAKARVTKGKGSKPQRR